jgi:branched-chain amino acid transport system substrate-binding protein
MRRILAAAGAASVLTTMLLAAGSLGGSLPASAASKSPITIGYISSLTGNAASTFVKGNAAAQAIIDDVNANGGVNGHQLKLVVKNDASTTNLDDTAAKELIADGATAIINYSPYAFGSAQYVASQHIPVIGSGFDGPEWAEKGYTNMFSWAVPAESPIDGKLHTTTADGKFLKSLGVTSFGGLGYGVSPSSTDSILLAEKSAEAEGIKICYTNNTVTFGATTFTADVLQIKAAGCGAIAGSFVTSSNLALSGDMNASGLTKVVKLFFEGYSTTISKTANNAKTANGAYFGAAVNFSPPNASTKSLLDILKKYDKTYTGGIPSYGVIGSAISAQLTVYGLKLAGSDPTSASFIKKLRTVKSWTDTGVLPSPIGFTGFGTVAMFPKYECGYEMKLTAGTWHPHKVCGTLISMTAPSSS